MTRNELQKIRHYLDVLGIPYDADFTIDDIESFYRTQSKVLHPDAGKVRNSHEKFIELTKARDYMKDNIGYVKQVIRNNRGFFGGNIYDTEEYYSPESAYSTRNYDPDVYRQKQQKKHNKKDKSKKKTKFKDDDREREPNSFVLFLVKFFRTLGYVLIGAGAAVLLLTSLIQLVQNAGGILSFLGDKFISIMDATNSLATSLEEAKIPNIAFYSLFSLFIGLFFVIITGRRSTGRKIVFSISLLGMLFLLLFIPASLEATEGSEATSLPAISILLLNLRKVTEPITFEGYDAPIILLTNSISIPAYLEPFVETYKDGFVSLNSKVPFGILPGLITAFFVFATMAALKKRRPKRASAGFVNAGYGLMTFLVIAGGIILQGVITYFKITNLMESSIYLSIAYLSLVLSYLLQFLGGLVGTIFFFVK
ncbi:MAG: J domain-containing protein [Acholeplasmataceae bacterium]|jgi:ABC-type transport system involved in cytochrome c biogenesis permease subunit